jgi:hypothetical protein
MDRRRSARIWDHMLHAVERERGADDGVRCAELPLPQSIAQDD